ncbi:MAG: hypothetical protein BGO05_05700 [Rhizobiales bacterium 63-7]|nr:DUF2793 domain-containing protein [Hyphomicrobiales bacterium]OJU66687.1 MAG: hypothetical protein BGO05_05700 [Rhizobiales bacterium 63-7]
MSEQTENLSLPYILPSQAQKHVTHNEALQRLDAVVQLVVTAALSAPPLTPAEGKVYAVTATATGDWAGQEGKLALRQDGAWLFLQPRAGWRAWRADTAAPVLHDGSGWVEPPLPSSGTMQQLGIATGADATNRLALSSPATLLTHAGAGHQLKINKASVDDTATLLFQSDWSGRAEIGLAGEDALSFKVSPDGASWRTALALTGHGRVHLPHRPLAEATRSAGSAIRTDGEAVGFDGLSLTQGDVALGATVPGGSGLRLLVPETGLYRLGLTLATSATAAHGVDLLRNGSTSLARIRKISTAGLETTAFAGALVSLAAGDWLSLSHFGTSTVHYGTTGTRLHIALE